MSQVFSQSKAGGTTALALFALMEGGESPQNERIKKGLDALVKVNTNDLYVRAVRTMALARAVSVTEDSPYAKPLKADVAWLTKGAATMGAWGYRGPQRDGDNSCSQFALLALWEAQRAGVKISPSIFRAVERTWLKRRVNRVGKPKEGCQDGLGGTR